MRRDGEGVVRSDWTLIVPLKPLDQAKSRLSGTAVGRLRPTLALAFAQDTVAAALAVPAVVDVVVVTDDPVAAAEVTALGAHVVADVPGAGLNAALEYGAHAVRRARPGAATAALGADLPALRPAELNLVLARAAHHPRAFLADAAGVGTTFLSASAGTPLAPAFGGRSRARHRASGAREIDPSGVESVRRDVDTGDDLRCALALGVGPYTAARLPAGTGGRAAPGPFV
ncbi:2-phospho-L-lactate guanylyltransferase [Streptomyces meridianus]|uniref:Phosphoenolpyruvate guanylyltransferase n=1 Tax=Streptomyces meridianus TaxID=2938945 RepID=A0ABT0XAB9_9ACTN|nr:2-phospho-L-lactate guanylyltransferase [Streptomyces meridianus]MCM2578749.1 2-phospho-L-lactate guanylyltransferase [Streptomyces meridianus]